jgi:hypothetical protein
MLVLARLEGKVSDAVESLVVFREKQSDGTWKHDYLLSNAWVATPLEEFARVFKAEHCIEECLQRAKGEAGLADYQVRTWEGWHHHQALALLATRKPGGEKIETPALTVPQVQKMIGQLLNGMLKCDCRERILRRANRRLRRNEEARLYHWHRRKRLPPRRFERRESQTQ